jgi:hypothetical protein
VPKRVKLAWWRLVCCFRGHLPVDVALHPDDGVLIARGCVRCCQMLDAPRAYTAAPPKPSPPTDLYEWRRPDGTVMAQAYVQPGQSLMRNPCFWAESLPLQIFRNGERVG